jgi:hypothetical protein
LDALSRLFLAVYRADELASPRSVEEQVLGKLDYKVLDRLMWGAWFFNGMDYRERGIEQLKQVVNSPSAVAAIRGYCAHGQWIIARKDEAALKGLPGNLTPRAGEVLGEDQIREACQPLSIEAKTILWWAMRVIDGDKAETFDWQAPDMELLQQAAGKVAQGLAIRP